MPELIDEQAISERLATARVVAVLGAHTEQYRAAFYVPEYLFHHGYRIIPINPQFAGQTMWGETVLASLTQIEQPVEIVDIFRPSAALAGHLDEILAMDPAPGLIWFQLGIKNDAVANKLVAAGIDVVQNRCTLADHRRFGISRPNQGE